MVFILESFDMEDVLTHSANHCDSRVTGQLVRLHIWQWQPQGKRDEEGWKLPLASSPADVP
jgi:hypothetical protein